MSLVVLDDVTLFFGDRLVFDAISLRLGHGDRVGLIGPNGSGKTTLLKIIAGDQEVDDGKVTRANGVRIGWLPQDLSVAGGRTLIDMILSSVPGKKELDAQLAATEEALSSGTLDDDQMIELAGELGVLHERIDHFDRFFGEHEALAILAGLGFAVGDEHRDIGEFSGGWKMRAVLAGLLFQRPDVLLLDEPTNHLDMPSVAWFGDFLKQWSGCFILISHDRDFLNDQIKRVVSLELEGVRSYPGNYERYLAARAEEETILVGRARNLALERERLTSFINRFRAQANKAKAVQSRVKMLEKMESVEVYEKRGTLRFSFPSVARVGGEPIKIDRLTKAYGEHVVFGDPVDVAVRRGEKIGIIGVNGAGKTTLLRMMAGEIPHDTGTIKIGSGVEVGYYAQHHADTLDMDATIYEIISRAAPEASPAKVRSMCGAFMFSGDDVDKKARVLSGGERARVALAKLCIAPGSLMLMDEPTNHLDLASSEALTESLKSYEGTLVFVSHNRSLIRNLATRIWNVEDGKVETYAGTLDEYMYSMAERRRGVGAEGSDQVAALKTTGAAPTKHATGKRAPAPAPAPVKVDDKARKRSEAHDRARRGAKLGPLEKQVAEFEARIGALEAEQKVRSAELSDPAVYDDAARRNKLLADYQASQDKLEELNARWEQTMAELESARANSGENLRYSVPVESSAQLIDGKYRLVEVLGEGGMATVYKAVQRGAAGFQRTVAIKHVKPEYRALKNYIDMFIEEARVGSELQHPNIVQVHDFISEHGSYYLVMEWVDGIDLGGFIRIHKEAGTPIPWPLAVAMGIGTLRGLGAAHARIAPDGTPSPVVHRDVSPHNVLLGSNGGVKLSDFGLAKARDRIASLTAPGTVKGKLSYLAPEVSFGRPNSPQSDLYGVGNVIWESLAGERLFDGKNDVEIFKKIRAAKVPPIRERRPDVPPALAAVLEVALAPDPADRYATATEFASALSQIIKQAVGVDPAIALGAAVREARARNRDGDGDQTVSDLVPPPARRDSVEVELSTADYPVAAIDVPPKKR